MLAIQSIFEAQEKLDCKVVEVHGLEGKNLTADVTHALYTELGELSNEVAYFKYWKKNKITSEKNKRDEWADCMHFVTSLGNKYGHVELIVGSDRHIRLANKFMASGSGFHELFGYMYKADYSCIFEYAKALGALIAIGYKLGMNHQDMMRSYFEKNHVNYDRLNSGY
ncbi:dUTP diphosphatase [Bacillus cereus]|nr:dUTP diphosphatase [Bacillus cereus]